MDITQLLDSAQDVGGVAQRVFDLLGSGIAGAGESTEGGHIGKIVIAELANIDRSGFAVGNDLGSLQKIGGQAQADGKIVGGTGGDIAHGSGGPGLKNTGHSFAESAVAAAADDHIKLVCLFPGHPGGISPAGSHVYFHSVVCPVENGENICQHLICFPGTGAGVHNKEHLFQKEHLIS